MTWNEKRSSNTVMTVLTGTVPEFLYEISPVKTAGVSSSPREVNEV